jgi:hypothetical protein
LPAIAPAPLRGSVIACGIGFAALYGVAGISPSRRLNFGDVAHLSSVLCFSWFVFTYEIHPKAADKYKLGHLETLVEICGTCPDERPNKNRNLIYKFKETRYRSLQLFHLFSVF